MFSTTNVYITISAVIMAMSFIVGAIYYVNRIFSDNTQEILVRFILLVFTALVGVFVVDKVIAWRFCHRSGPWSLGSYAVPWG